MLTITLPSDWQKLTGKTRAMSNESLNIEKNGQLYSKTCFGMLMPSSV